MLLNTIHYIVIPLILFSLTTTSHADPYEINGAIDSTEGAPLPMHMQTHGEKLILVDPNEHYWGAYNSQGKLIRWGIASAGADWCTDSDHSCRTKTGIFRIYSLGESNCISTKFPIPDGGAPMPYCMYFTNGQAIHGSSETILDNESHGCVRIHIDEAKWLRHHFAEGPASMNHYHGTKVMILPYATSL